MLCWPFLVSHVFETSTYIELSSLAAKGEPGFSVSTSKIWLTMLLKIAAFFHLTSIIDSSVLSNFKPCRCSNGGASRVYLTQDLPVLINRAISFHLIFNLWLLQIIIKIILTAYCAEKTSKFLLWLRRSSKRRFGFFWFLLQFQESLHFLIVKSFTAFPVELCILLDEWIEEIWFSIFIQLSERFTIQF